jgi:hypothetical protein
MLQHLWLETRFVRVCCSGKDDDEGGGGRRRSRQGRTPPPGHLGSWSWHDPPIPRARRPDASEAADVPPQAAGRLSAAPEAQTGTLTHHPVEVGAVSKGAALFCYFA